MRFLSRAVAVMSSSWRCLAGMAFAFDLPGRVADRVNDHCDSGNYRSTRHRSGSRPRHIVDGLHRRACVFTARIAPRPARLPDFDYTIKETDEVQLPAIVDSNSPAIWQDGRLRVFNSAWEEVYRSEGDGLDSLGEPVPVQPPYPGRPGAVWIESVWLDQATDTLYGWYHFEPADLECQTAPLIGAAVSNDGGLTWKDRGIVLSSAAGLDCDYDNGYFSGGNGDFSVVLSPDKKYFYFLFTNYAGPVPSRG